MSYSIELGIGVNTNGRKDDDADDSNKMFHDFVFFV